MRYLAPAGTPISLQDLASGLGAGVFGAASERLTAELVKLSGCAHGWLMSSGRAAMTVIANAMRSANVASHKDEIIVPAYTCYSVPAAIARAGLHVRLCDIDPATLSYDLDALARIDRTRVLGIVTANLYGIPNELSAIEAYARQNDIFMLDDAAQALGAKYAGRAVGGFGDVGLYSFDKGKNIATIQGGAIVASDAKLAHAIETQYAALPDTPTRETLLLLAKLFAYSLLLRPTAYGVVRRMPFLGLGQTPYETTCLIAKYSGVLAGMGGRLLTHLQLLTATRRRHAEALMAALDAVPALRNIRLLPGAEPAYARLPLLVRDPQQRPLVLDALDRAGIGATASYPAALCDVPQAAAIIRNNDAAFLGARQVALSIVTLPTHPYCPADLPECVYSALESVRIVRAGT